MGRKNLWMKRPMEQVFNAYLAQLKDAGAEILPNEVVAAGLAMFFDLDEEKRLKAIERGRNYDLELIRLGKALDAVAVVEAADEVDGQAQKGSRRKSGGAKR